MTAAGGFLGAVCMVGAVSLIVIPATSNLSGTTHLGVLGVTLATALVSGFIAGSVVLRRVAARRDHAGLFSGVAGGIATGVAGAVIVLSLLAAYLSTYGNWPAALLDQTLMVLSFPILGTMGFCIGGLVGGIAGLLAGGALRLAFPARR